MVKKFTIPFASQGDANDIPDALQVDGKVSFTQGFGYDYERPYDDPQAKDIAREDMNGLFKAITSAVGELQTLGASEWSSAIAYPKGAIVYHEKDLYISQVDDNQNKPPQNWISITSIANDSLKKAANLSDLTNKATARNNLGLGNSATLNKTDVLGTSTSLVATQKLVNDTKINLESSKQDKLDFIGNGKVMKEGAGGLLGRANSVPYVWSRFGERQSQFIHGDGSEIYPHPVFQHGSGIHIDGRYYASSIQISSLGAGAFSQMRDTGQSTYFMFYTEKNTTVDKSGFLRASGSADALTTSDVTQSLGTSTTLAASQALVNSINQNLINTMFGYNQKYADVTSTRSLDTVYTNNTGKMIAVIIHGSAIEVYVDNLMLCRGRAYNDTVTFFVPSNSTYKVLSKSSDEKKLERWSELR